jgi:DNA polymerase
MALPVAKILELLEMELAALGDEGVDAAFISPETIDFLRPSAPVKSDRRPEKSIGEESALPPTDGLRKILLPAGSGREKYEWLKNEVLSCEALKKHVRPGKKLVFGIGDVDADILFCGEAPGADEEVVGEPFVGRAGQLLTRIINAMGLTRDGVYITNIMNWRPEMPTETGNRPPTQEEMKFCLPYLLAQIEIVRPRVIVALGATAIGGLLGPDPSRRMGDVRGKWLTFAGIPLMATFHPSYLLRNNTKATKRAVWEDMLLVMESVNLPIDEGQRNYFL